MSYHRKPKQETMHLIPDDGFVSHSEQLAYSFIPNYDSFQRVEGVEDYEPAGHSKPKGSRPQGKARAAHDQQVQHC